MAIVEYDVDETVAVITLNNGENRFNPDFFKAFLKTLDDVEHKTDASTIVITSSDEKIFLNGIDLDWIQPALQNRETESVKNFLYQFNDMFKRLITIPMLTVAAISGHAFAGGAFMACACDFRFMRSDRGYFCFPEIDINMPFLPGMIAVVRKAVPLSILNEMYYTGIRLTADECERYQIIKKACHQDDLMNETMAFAKLHNKKRETIGEMKKRMNKESIRVIDEDDPPYIEKL